MRPVSSDAVPSGAPPTETGPTALGTEGIGGTAATGSLTGLRAARMRILDGGMLPVVSGPTAPCSALTCAVSA